MSKTVSAFAPISIGNLSVGFDSLGMAVKTMDGPLLGDIVTVTTADKTQLSLQGSYVARLPGAMEDNIVWHCMNTYHDALAKIGRTSEPLHLTLEKNIPVSSGLGSSACSVVAALVALNHYYDNAFDDTELLALMAQEEGKISGSVHYDNIAPCFLGGVQLMTPQHSTPCVRLPALDGIYWVMAYPDILISTRAARDVLPKQFSREISVAFAQNLAAFVAASLKHDTPMAMAHLMDVLVEPYRQDLLPNYTQHKTELMTMGCAAVGISGSGPTLFAATTDLATAQAAQTYLSENYATKEQAFVYICTTDTEGARQLS